MNYIPVNRGSMEYIDNRNKLIEQVKANLTVFETEVKELERLWLIHDKNRTADPAMFVIGVSLWRTRRQSLQDQLRVYWSAEESKGHEWVSFCEKQEDTWIIEPDSAISTGVIQTDRATSTAQLIFQTNYDALVKRCEEVDLLQVEWGSWIFCRSLF